jgi:serine/threonine-protein kinase HipA
VELAPAYDFLSTTIAMKNPREELALPLRGKKSRLTRNDLMEYFAHDRLQLNERVFGDVVSRFMKAIPLWRDLLNRSFLSEEMKQKFVLLLDERTARLQL